MKEKTFVWLNNAYGYKSVSEIGTSDRGGRLGDIGNKKSMANTASVGCIGSGTSLWGIEQVSSVGKGEYTVSTVSTIGCYLTGEVL